MYYYEKCYSCNGRGYEVVEEVIYYPTNTVIAEKREDCAECNGRGEKRIYEAN